MSGACLFITIRMSTGFGSAPKKSWPQGGGLSGGCCADRVDFDQRGAVVGLRFGRFRTNVVRLFTPVTIPRLVPDRRRYKSGR